ncbi:hypothetical protein HK102_003973 [Quaeritorhiza haematococci]|nr:hypothetical protein HK102_003973 [Quaeritorhiza haematococci]
MRTSIFFIATILLILASPALALPNGAPKCALNPQVVANGHETAPNPAMGYGIQVSGPISPGQRVNFTVTNNAGRNTFNGILMYVQGQNPSIHIGKFVNLNTNFFRPQRPNICAAANLRGDLLATITHANPNPKPIADSFQWEMLPEDAAADPGPYQIISAIAISPQEWMVVPPVPLQVAGGAPPAAPGTPGAPANPGTPPAPPATPPAPATPPPPVVVTPQESGGESESAEEDDD